MEKLIKQGRVSRSHLGVSGDAVINATGERLLSSGQPLYGLSITAVNANGPAAEAGLEVGDILLEVAGQRFDSVQQALNMIAEATPNSTLALTIDRAGQRITINAV